MFSEQHRPLPCVFRGDFNGSMEQGPADWLCASLMRGGPLGGFGPIPPASHHEPSGDIQEGLICIIPRLGHP